MYAASIRLGPWADYLRAASFKVSWREHLLFAMSSYSALWEDLLLGWIGSAKMIRPGIGEEQRARWTSPSKLSHGTAPFNSRARGEVRAMGCLYHFNRPGPAQIYADPIAFYRRGDAFESHLEGSKRLKKRAPVIRFLWKQSWQLSSVDVYF